jgi:hypothetical protein
LRSKPGREREAICEQPPLHEIVASLVRLGGQQPLFTQREKPGRLGGGGYRQAWLNNKIVTLCNALINHCICCKWAFYSQRACALIPAWRGMGDPRVESPIECEGERGLALRHRIEGMQHFVCGLPRTSLPRRRVNKARSRPAELNPSCFVGPTTTRKPWYSSWWRRLLGR